MRTLLLGLLLCTGCGSSILATPNPPPVSAELTPNYVSSLQSLHHWGTRQVKVRFEALTEAQARDVERAMQLWNQALAGQAELVRTSDSDAQLSVSMTDPSSLDGAAGTATIQYEQGSGRLRTGRVLLSRALDESWLPVIAAHELGHALGIVGHSPHDEDIMYPAPAPRLWISERDRNTLLVAYRQRRSQAKPALPEGSWKLN